MTDNPDIAGGGNSRRVAASELKASIERIERLKDERADLAEDIKAERVALKGKGYQLKVVDEMLKLRALERDERNERESIRQLYADALGLFD